MELILLSGLFTMVGIAACFLWWRAPYNLIYSVSVLNIGFFLTPPLLWSIFEVEVFEYGLSIIDRYTITVADPGDLTFLLGLASALLLGAYVGEQLLLGIFGCHASRSRRSDRPDVAKTDSGGASWSTWVLAGSLAMLWTWSASVFLPRSGYDLVDYFIASRRNVYSAFGYPVLLLLYVNIPAGLAFARYMVRSRLGVIGVMLLGMSLIAAVGTGQRIYAITLLLSFCFVWLCHQRGSVARGFVKLSRWRAARSRLVLALSLTTVAAVGLWWGRAASNQLAQGRAIALPTLGIERSAALVFGSPATGYPTFLALQDYIDIQGHEYFYMGRQAVASLVPRAVWPEKPENVAGKLVSQLALETNPSLFLLNEFWLSAGYGALLAALLFGGFVSACMTWMLVKGGTYWWTVAGILTGGVVSLFKDGLAVFVPRMAVPLAVVTLFALNRRIRGRRRSVGQVVREIGT